MKGVAVLQSFLILILVIVSVLLWRQTGELEEKIESQNGMELHLLMGHMSRYLHKFSYSVDEENALLADFYLHELEELSEDIIENIEEYDGFPIGELTATILIPVIEEAEQVIETEDWGTVREMIPNIVNSCNNCHSATNHGYIHVTPRSEVNPFNQDFRRLDGNPDP